MRTAISSLAVALLVGLSCGGGTSYHAIADDEVVRFRDGRTVAPADWMEVDYDDSSWREGPAPVGLGRRVATRVEGLGREFVTLYVRVPFDLGPTAAQVTRLYISAPVLGGGYAVWINGVEVARDSLPRGTPFDRAAPSPAAPRDLVVDVPAGTLRPAGNVVAIEARCPSPAEELVVGFTLDAEPPLDVAGILRGPYVQRLGPDGATIVFDTGDEVPGRVVVDGRRFDGPPATHHEIAVTGLAPSTVYPYHVEAAGSRSEPLELATAPGLGEPVAFLVYGDTRTNGDLHRRIARAMAAETVDVAIHTGDLVATGGDEEEWDAFFTIEYPLLTRTALYPAVGNHETNGSGGVDNFKRVFALPDDPSSPARERLYSFDVGDVHFTAIDSNLPFSMQVEWIERDAERARSRGARRLFWFLHHGPYSAGSRHGGSSSARAVLVPLARRLGVDAIFGGHDHIYERGDANGLRYFVSGGGGAPLHGVDALPSTRFAVARPHYIVVRVDGDRVTVEAKDPDGVVFDSTEW